MWYVFFGPYHLLQGNFISPGTMVLTVTFLPQGYLHQIAEMQCLVRAYHDNNITHAL